MATPAVLAEVLAASNAANTEYLVFLRHYKSGEGLLLGVLETQEAASAIADTINRLIRLLPVRPSGG
jgi:hypothetical protein